MATVGSSPTTLSSVKTVFGGGSPPNNLRAYLRNTVYVNNIPSAYPNIPTSGTVRLVNFAGLIKPTTTAPDPISVWDYSYGFTATAAFSFYNTGIRYGGSGSGSAWLLSGSASDYDIYFQKTSGDHVHGSANATWLNLGTSREWYVTTDGLPGTVQAGGLCYIRNTTATNYTLNSITISLTAETEEATCPNCCFTPETLILMATGDWMAIVDVQEGDEIATRHGSKKVTEVITRTNRVMYAIEFADGRILNASEDHPLYVVDKGYAAINPGIGGAYKDLGIPDQLYVGDLVLDSDGRENAIVSITDLDYPETVYTFAESEFYANGMLVY